MPDLSPTLTNSERRRVAELLWKAIANVEKGATPYWTGQQLRLIAEIVEPHYWPKDRPTNAEARA